jgi:hypothetical protein
MCAATARFMQITREYHGLNLHAMITALRVEAKFAERNASMPPLFTSFAWSV